MSADALTSCPTGECSKGRRCLACMEANSRAIVRAAFAIVNNTVTELLKEQWAAIEQHRAQMAEEDL